MISFLKYHVPLDELVGKDYARSVLQPLVKEQLARTDAREDEEVLNDKEYLTNVDL